MGVLSRRRFLLLITPFTKLPDANRAAEEESDREEKMMRQPNNPAGNLLSIRAQDGDFASLTSTSQMKNELLQL
jgi:hypothetical protein